MSLAGISLRDLEYIVAVASEGSFVAAASLCGVSQPSLSSQVRKVEQWFGAPIFERNSRKVLVTAAGQDFIERAARVVVEARQLRQTAQSTAGPFGTELRLSAISTLGPYFFPRVIGDLKQSYPKLKFSLGEGVTETLLGDLQQGRLDCVLVSPPLGDASVMTATLFQEPFVLACPMGVELAGSPEEWWSTLVADKRLLLEMGHCLRHQALSMCSHNGANNRQAASLETLKYMVAAGEGYTLIPSLAARPTQNVSYLPLSGSPFSREIVLAWRVSDPRGPAFNQLSAHFRSIARKKLDLSRVPAA